MTEEQLGMIRRASQLQKWLDDNGAGRPNPDTMAVPVSWRHTESECSNCGRPIFTNAQVSARANQKDPWRHSDTAQQSCQAGLDL